MKLTEEQWDLIQPLLPPCQGKRKPLHSDREVLDGILWVLSKSSAWHRLPSNYPSYQTCNRRYLRWLRSGVMVKICAALFQDLRQRGGLDFADAFVKKEIAIVRRRDGLHFEYPSHLDNTWQLDTAVFFYGLFLTDLCPPRYSHYHWHGCSR